MTALEAYPDSGSCITCHPISIVGQSVEGESSQHGGYATGKEIKGMLSWVLVYIQGGCGLLPEHVIFAVMSKGLHCKVLQAETYNIWGWGDVGLICSDCFCFLKYSRLIYNQTVMCLLLWKTKQYSWLLWW